MDSVVRALIVYVILLVVIRLSGKRTLSETTPFDMVLLLIISETVQQALIDNDHSITNATILVITLVLADVSVSLMKIYFRRFERVMEGTAVILMENGKFHKERMQEARVDEEDVMEAARALHGLERIDQVKFAVMEKNGTITIIPKSEQD